MTFAYGPCMNCVFCDLAMQLGNLHAQLFISSCLLWWHVVYYPRNSLRYVLTLQFLDCPTRFERASNLEDSGCWEVEVFEQFTA